MNEEPVIDLQQLGDASANDPGLQRELLDLYTAQLTAGLQDLWRFMDASSWPELGSLAHKLSGSSLLTGMKAMGKALRAVEESALAGDCSPMPSQLKEVEAQFLRLKAELVRQSLSDP